MLEFRDVIIEMKPQIDSYFKNSNNWGSEYTFSNLFIWRKNNHTAVAWQDGFLFARYRIKDKYYFLMPVAENGGRDTAKAVESLIEYAVKLGCVPVITGLGKEGSEKLERLMPGRFEFRVKTEWSDYIYNSDDLINLKGAKYQAKRNHINRFENQNGTGSFEELNAGNIPHCLETYERWVNEHPQLDLQAESTAVHEALNNFEQLGLKGGLIRTGNRKVCAFTIGSEINSDIFVIHIEKGLNDCSGVYAVINRDFARHACQNYRYINREEDMGIEGLRKAKRSYYPVMLLEKYVAELKNL